MSEAVKPIRKLLPAGLKQQAVRVQNFMIQPEEGTTLEDVLRPEYWSHVAKGIIPTEPCKIEVWFKDTKRYVLLAVVASGPLWANVKVMQDVMLTTADAAAEDNAPEPEDFKALHKGSVAKWVVKRLSDGALLINGLQSKEEANAWIEAHKKSLAA